MKCKADTPVFNSKDNFHRIYRNHAIDIERDPANNLFYIIVTAPNGCLAYDGWWRDSEYKTIQEAFKEAVRGSQI